MVNKGYETVTDPNFKDTLSKGLTDAKKFGSDTLTGVKNVTTNTIKYVDEKTGAKEKLTSGFSKAKKFTGNFVDNYGDM